MVQVARLPPQTGTLRAALLHLTICTNHTVHCHGLLQFLDLHLEMRGGKLGLDFGLFDATTCSTGKHTSLQGESGETAAFNGQSIQSRAAVLQLMRMYGHVSFQWPRYDCDDMQKPVGCLLCKLHRCSFSKWTPV